MANEVRIRASLDDKVSGPLTKVKDKFDLLGKSGGFKALVQGVGLGAGVAGFNLLGSAAGKAVDILGDTITAASDLNEAVTLGKQVFAQNAGEMEAWADGAADAFGQSKREALAFASGFGNAFKNVGMSLDETADKSKDLTRLAADLGSAFNASSEEAATALRSGLLGESEPLRRFGVFLDEAKVKAKAAALGLKPLNGALTDGQKVAARYAIIMEQTADSQGMFGRDSESLADTQKSLSAEMENVSAELGQKLLPLALDFTRWARDEAVPVVTDLVDVMDELGNSAAADVVGALADVVGGLHGVSPASDKLVQDFYDLQDAAEESSNAMSGQITAAGHAVRTAAGKAGKSVLNLADTTDKATDRVVISWSDMVDALTGQTSRLIDDVHDPAIQYAELATIAEEDAALRRVIKSKESTDEEVRDAKRRRLSLAKEADRTRLELLESGSLTASDTDKWLKELEKEYKGATGTARGQIALLIAKIKELAHITAKGIDIQIRGLPGGGIGSGGGGRASGGPIDPKKVYMVGERGPELFVSNDAGSIIPNHKLGGGVGPMNMGTGGMSVALHFHGMAYPPSPAQQREMAQNLGPALREYLDRRG